MSRLYISLILALLLASCSYEENTSNIALGHVQFVVTMPPDVADDLPVALDVSTADGQYWHTWSDYREFPVFEGFYAGKYIATAYWGKIGDEGYDCPCYLGRTEFEISDGVMTTVPIDCQLTQAIFNVDCTDAFLSMWDNAHLLLHSSGNGYVEAVSGDERPLYVLPGNTSVYIAGLQDAAGNDVTIATDMRIVTEAGHPYRLTLDVEGDGIKIVNGTDEVYVDVNQQILDAKAPVIRCLGFEDGTPINLTEGMAPTHQIAMDVILDSPLRSLMLSAKISGAGFFDIGEEIDLLNDRDTVESLLLSVDQTDTGYTIDYTRLLSSISVSNIANCQLMLVAVDVNGRVSNIAELIVSIQGVSIQIVEVSKADIGVNMATVTLALNVPMVEREDITLRRENIVGTEQSDDIEIVTYDFDTATSRVTLSFKVPEGINDIDVAVEFMGNRQAGFTVERAVPDYTITIDPFATSFYLDIHAESAAIAEALTRYVMVYVDGREFAVLDRDYEYNRLYCAGLSADKSYVVETRVIDGGFAPSLMIRTERAQQVPDGDFEEFRNVYEYEHVPAGGLYSSTSLPIYNNQNYTDIKVSWPKKTPWTSINEKTMCRTPNNYNTWYIQPSAAIDFGNCVSGSKSIEIRSIGWSLTGGDIPPYVQEAGKYEPYNGNVPPIDNISAGYMFLGTYSYDKDTRNEVYTEGISFASRPSSLNGFYRYQPDRTVVTDRGWVRIELVADDGNGSETVLSSGYMEFSSSPDFRSFNIPLDYNVLYLQPTKLRILFCSSVNSIGLSFDDPTVPVSPNLAESRYQGSSLWIDNLTFSY